MLRVTIRLIGLIALITLPTVNWAATTITCKNIEGFRTSFFTKASKVKTNSFIFTEDSISEGELKLILNHEDKTAWLEMPNTKAMGNSYKTKLVPLHYDSDPLEQLTFAGVLNGAPIMFTYFPEQNIAFYTMHTVYSGVLEGAKAVQLHAECKSN